MTRPRSSLARRWLLALGLAAALGSTAWARVVTYVARNGDTPESVAADFYGNRSLAHLISEGNGQTRETRFRPGQKVRIPTAVSYRVRKGDTLEALALRFLDDRRRAPLLAQLSNLRNGDKLREGQEITIPFQHLHVADAPESLASVARAFYGDAGKAKLLADFNFRASPMLAKGDKIVVPIAHVHIRAVRLAAAAAAPPRPAGATVTKEQHPPPPKDTQAREAELAERVAGQLRTAERAYKDGDYAEVTAQLDTLLAAEDPSEAQLAEIFRLKAFAYVALGMEEPAVNAFREVLARKPELKLDEATVSPKIRAALDRARKAN